MPVLAATLTTIVVFFPVTFLFGVSRFLFSALAVAVVLALLASYVVALTVIPLFCAGFLRPFTPAGAAGTVGWTALARRGRSRQQSAASSASVREAARQRSALCRRHRSPGYRGAIRRQPAALPAACRWRSFREPMPASS